METGISNSITTADGWVVLSGDSETDLREDSEKLVLSNDLASSGSDTDSPLPERPKCPPPLKSPPLKSPPPLGLFSEATPPRRGFKARRLDLSPEDRIIRLTLKSLAKPKAIYPKKDRRRCHSEPPSKFQGEISPMAKDRRSSFTSVSSARPDSDW